MSVSNILAPINYYWSCRKANKSQPLLLTDKELSVTGALLKELCEVRLRLLAAPRTWMQQEAQCAQLRDTSRPTGCNPAFFSCLSLEPVKVRCLTLVKTAFCESRKGEITETMAEIYRGVLQPQTEMLLDCSLKPVSTH